MNRRDFIRYGTAAGVGIAARGVASAHVLGGSSGSDAHTFYQGEMELPRDPAFRTRHVVFVILGSGARKQDVLTAHSLAPAQRRLVDEATVFVDDFGDTVHGHGHMYSELLCGNEAPTQRPQFPTWQEMVRKSTGCGPLDSWILQSQSYFGGWSWDVKNYSQHPSFGAGFGATNLTMNNLFLGATPLPTNTFVQRFASRSVGFDRLDQDRIAAWYRDLLERRGYIPRETRMVVLDRPTQIGDAMALTLAPQILKTFRPKCLTIQIVGLEDAHREAGSASRHTGFDVYRHHLGTMDELIGDLWTEIQHEPTLRDRTALVIRPECGRNEEIDRLGQLSHSPGSPSSHSVWCMALGPDFKRGHLVEHRVQRRDIAPTLTYLMTGRGAAWSNGHVRTQMFADRFGLPDYRLPPTRELPPSALD